MGSKLLAVEYYLPEQIRTNHDIETICPDCKAEKTEKKLGIVSRHIAAPNETALGLAEKACELLFGHYDRTKIDYLLFCTQSPDYFLPTTACILQNQLGLRKQVGALDFNLGCSGFGVGYSYGATVIRLNLE